MIAHEDPKRDLPGLAPLYRAERSLGARPATVEKVRNTITFLQDMEDVLELRDVSTWKAHPLTGDRKGTWSLSVTKNWRITFGIDKQEREIFDLNYEDYH